MELVALSGQKGSGKNTAANVLIEKHGFQEFSLAKPLKELVSHIFDIPMNHLEDAVLKEKDFATPIVLNHEFIYQIHKQCSFLLNLDMFKKSESKILEGMITKSVKRKDKNTYIPKSVIKLLSSSDNSPNYLQGQLEYKSFENPRKLLQFIGTELIRDCISPYFWIKVLDNKIKFQSKVILTDVRFLEEREFVRFHKGLLIKVERIQPHHTAKDGSSSKKTDVHASETSLGSNDEYDYILRNDGTIDDLTSRLETLYQYDSLVRQDKIYPLGKANE